jgi:hypothetical protein
LVYRHVFITTRRLGSGEKAMINIVGWARSRWANRRWLSELLKNWPRVHGLLMLSASNLQNCYMSWDGLISAKTGTQTTNSSRTSSWFDCIEMYFARKHHFPSISLGEKCWNLITDLRLHGLLSLVIVASFLLVVQCLAERVILRVVEALARVCETSSRISETSALAGSYLSQSSYKPFSTKNTLPVLFPLVLRIRLSPLLKVPGHYYSYQAHTEPVCNVYGYVLTDDRPALLQRHSHSGSSSSSALLIVPSRLHRPCFSGW